MKRTMLILSALLILCLLIPVSCAKAPSEEYIPAPEVTVEVPPAPMAPGTRLYEETGAGTLPSVSEERMIVRSGDISLIVEDVVGARDEIAQLAVAFDGYVVSSRISGEEPDRTGWISIRVPDERFDEALTEIRNLAVRVTSESTSSQDVTEEYIDLQARLKNAEATENQYLTLLEKTEDVEDILRIYERLSQVQQEIEQIKGQMQYLERTTSMSLISVYLKPEATAKPLVRAGWSAWETLKSAARGFIIFMQWIGIIFLWLLIFIPIWGTVVGIIWWRRRKKQKSA